MTKPVNVCESCPTVQPLPRVTLAVLSWNRLHYLKATLESARKCIQYPDVEWIVSDNESCEPGLREYIDSLDWVQHKWSRQQSHAEAMNEIVRRATGQYLILWPEDVQFVLAGDWLSQVISILDRNPDIGSVGLDAVRRCTLAEYFGPLRVSELSRILRELYWYRGGFRRRRVLHGSGGVRLHTLGYRCSGICGSGIPSLTRMDVWRRLGPWRVRSELSTGLVDSSGGAECDMYRRFHQSRLPLQTAIMAVPAAADILTDPLGCKAKVRRNFRYGVYMPAPSPDGLYYEVRPMAQFQDCVSERPLTFMEMVRPIGFRIPTDAQGDRLKAAINTSVVFDIANNKEVDYPLLTPAP